MIRWQKTTLGDAFELYQPQTISSAKLVDGGAYAVYGANGVIGRHDQYNHEESQVLMTCRGATCGTINVSQPMSWINGNAMVVKPKNDSIDKGFLVHLLKGGIDLSKAITGAAQPQITRQSLSPISFSYPPLQEQRRIAAILDKADTLRVLRREALAELDRLAQSIFIDFFGEPSSNPMNWPTYLLKELGKVSTGGTPPSTMSGMFGGNIPFVTPGDLESDKLVRRTVTEAGAREAGTVRAGATLVCCIGATIGKIGRSHITSSFNQQLNAIEWSSSQVHDDYGFAVMQFFKPTIIAWGASTTLPILKKSTFEKIEIPIPPIKLQEKFGNFIERLEKIRISQKIHAATTEELFLSLQSKAFLGGL